MHHPDRRLPNTLQYAASKSRASIVTLLLNLPLKATHGGRYTPARIRSSMLKRTIYYLRHASTNPPAAVLSELIKASKAAEHDYDDAYRQATSNRDGAMVSAVLDAINDESIKRKQLESVLHHASNNGDPVITKLFLDTGADIGPSIFRRWRGCERRRGGPKFCG